MAQMTREVQAPKVVMGPGTGLGQANVLWDKAEARYRVWPSGKQLKFSHCYLCKINFSGCCSTTLH